MESNHLMPPYQDGAHPESFAGVDPSGRLELPCQHYRSCGSPSILAGNGTGNCQNKTKLSPALKANQLLRFTRPGRSTSMLAGRDRPRKKGAVKTKPARSFDLAGMKSNYSKSAQVPGRASVLTVLWVMIGSAPKWSFCVTQ